MHYYAKWKEQRGSEEIITFHRRGTAADLYNSVRFV